jgi:hypothetical protein
LCQVERVGKPAARALSLWDMRSLGYFVVRTASLIERTAGGRRRVRESYFGRLITNPQTCSTLRVSSLAPRKNADRKNPLPRSVEWRGWGSPSLAWSRRRQQSAPMHHAEPTAEDDRRATGFTTRATWHINRGRVCTVSYRLQENQRSRSRFTVGVSRVRV